MLVERATARDVQHRAAADSEHGKAARHRTPGQRELEAVELGSVGPSSGCSSAP